MRRPDEPPCPAPRAVVPVFPLPNVFLFPGCVMPLHVFEPRYRQMVQDLLDGQGRLVIAPLVEGAQAAGGRPAIHTVAGLGEIGRHEKLEDGRFLIWLIGLARVRIEEVPSERLYRRVAVEPLPEIDVPADAAAALRARVQTALLERCAEFLNLPSGVPLGHLVDLLLQRLELPGARLQQLYAEPCLRTRAEGALSEHAQRPPGASGTA
jgi:Lon protease-like protein